MSRRSKFIVFEGIDACGKGTQMLKAAEYIYSKDKAYNLEIIREPTYGKVGQEIRKILKTENNPLSGAEKCFDLYLEDRKANHEKIIYPALNKDLMGGRYATIVLCDRYWYSTYAYQGAQGIDKNRIVKANKQFIVPDLLLIYDLPAKVALERARGRDKNRRDKFEIIDFQEKVRQNYLEIAKFSNTAVINANPTLEEISSTNFIWMAKKLISKKRRNKASIDYIFEKTKKAIDKILPY